MKTNAKQWLKSEPAKTLGWCTLIVSTWRLGLEIVNQILVPFIKPVSNFMTQPDGIHLGLHRWLQWDGRWYLGIVQGGYQHHASQTLQQENIAFFPAFPALVRVISDITRIPYAYCGLLVNFLLCIGTAFMIYRLYGLFVKKYGYKRPAVGPWLAVGAVFAFPASLFLAAFYVEALLVLTMTAAIVFSLERRYWLAALCAGIASGTKIIGVISAPAVLILFLEQEGVLKLSLKQAVRKYAARLAALAALSLSGIIAYAVYLWIRFGDPLLLYSAHKAWGRKEGGIYFKSAWDIYYSHLFQPHYFGDRYEYLMGLFVMAVPVLALIGAIMAIKKKIWWLAVYLLLMVILPLSSGTLLSVNRLALVLAPAAVLFVAWLPANKYKYLVAVLYLSLMVQLILAAGFLQGSYFAG